MIRRLRRNRRGSVGILIALSGVMIVGGAALGIDIGMLTLSQRKLQGTADEAALAALRQGVMLKDGMTRPARARRIEEPPHLWDRDPPVRMRKTIPTSWIELVIREGRNRQVRRMTAAVGFPTLRLIRWSIGAWTIDGVPSGQWQRAPDR